MNEAWRRDCYNIDRVRTAAKRRLPKPVFDFIDGGADDESTVRRNDGDFDGYSFLPRPLDGPGMPDPSVELLGSRLSMPLMVGPTGLAGLVWPGGEAAAARAAATAGTVYCLSHGSVCRLEDLPRSASAPRWMQVFVYRDRSFTAELAQRAAAAGYDALVLTTDNQVLGNRERDIRNGFAIPPRFPPRDLLGMAVKFPWLLRMRAELPRITFGNYVREGQPLDIGSLAKKMAQLLDPTMSWRDVDTLRQVWKGRLILKGILHPAEAREAVERGVDAIIVSNHGGRQLDGAVSGIEALPAIVGAVAGRIPVLLDGGVRRGTDVLKARALGAACCLIARPQLWGLAVAGEAGVSHVLELYRREIVRAMALLGAGRMDGVTEDLIRRDVAPAPGGRRSRPAQSA